MSEQTAIVTCYPLGIHRGDKVTHYTVAAVLPGGRTLIHKTVELPTLRRAQKLALRVQKRGTIAMKEWK